MIADVAIGAAVVSTTEEEDVDDVPTTSLIATDFHCSPPRHVELLTKHWQSVNHMHVSRLALKETKMASELVRSFPYCAH